MFGFGILIGSLLFAAALLIAGLRSAQKEAKESALVGGGVSILLLMLIPAVSLIGMFWLVSLFLPLAEHQRNLRDPQSFIIILTVGMTGFGLGFLIAPIIINRLVFGNQSQPIDKTKYLPSPKDDSSKYSSPKQTISVSSGTDVVTPSCSIKKIDDSYSFKSTKTDDNYFSRCLFALSAWPARRHFQHGIAIERKLTYKMLASLLRARAHTIQDLESKGFLSPEQLKLFGNSLIEIITSLPQLHELDSEDRYSRFLILLDWLDNKSQDFGDAIPLPTMDDLWALSEENIITTQDIFDRSPDLLPEHAEKLRILLVSLKSAY